MKVINEKDYSYKGKVNGWYLFETKPKVNFDPERLMVKRARMICTDGTSRFFGTTRRNFD